jgi:hypothetical protein
MTGTHTGCSLVYTRYGDNTYGKGRYVGVRRKSPDQQTVGAFVTAATRNWDNLTDAQREAWLAYARTYFATDENGRQVRPSGIATYVRANVVRQLLGLALTTDAPTQAPPNPLTSAVLLPADDMTTYGFNLVHSIAPVTGHMVLVRITPAMPTVACTPDVNDLRYIKGLVPGSAAALVASGSAIAIDGGRFTVNEGQRMGFQLRVVRTADGIAGPAFFRSALRTAV